MASSGTVPFGMKREYFGTFFILGTAVTAFETYRKSRNFRNHKNFSYFLQINVPGCTWYMCCVFLPVSFCV